MPVHHTFRRSLSVAAAGGLLLGGLVGASPAVASGESAAPRLNVALLGDVDTLNPFTAILATSTNILGLQYEGLVGYDAESNEVSPEIADSWETSEDGLTWTFTFADDRVWSDGEPLTANDAEWTFQAIQEDDTLKQANGSLLENVASVEATDDTTLVLTLVEPQAPNPGSTLPVVPEHVWSEIDDPSTFENTTDAVGSGPFIVTEYSPTSGVTMAANPNYWRGAAGVSGITWVPYRNSDAAVQALITGEIDLINQLTPAQYQALEGRDGITVNAGSGRRYQALNLNSGARDIDDQPMGDGNPVLRDPEVRRAIVRAIDSDALLERVLEGLGEPATGEIPAVYPLYHWDTDDVPYGYDPDAANQILDDAGYELGADGVRLDENGEPIQLRLLGRNSDPTHQQMADYIIPWLAEIGISVSSEMKAPAQVNNDSIVGNYDMYFTGWGIGPDPDFQLSINQCSSRPNADGTGATNESNWCSPEFDEVYRAQHTELDQDRRSELVVEAQQLIYDAAVNNVLFYADALEAYRSDRFEPFVTQPSEDGVILGQNGPWGLYSATPVGDGADAAAGGGVQPIAVILPVAGVLIVGGIVAYLVLRRRRATADDRE